MHTVEIMVCIAKNLFIYSNVEKGENVKFVFFNRFFYPLHYTKLFSLG